MNWVKSLYFKQVAFVVAFTILIIGSIPAKSMAYVVGSETMVAPIDRAADMAAVQRVLESRIVADKLTSMGLTSTEIRDRLGKLTDAELHQFAKQIDSLYPGGDALGAVIAILVIVILVLLILKMTDRKIIIK
jgi:hypothetical protein